MFKQKKNIVVCLVNCSDFYEFYFPTTKTFCRVKVNWGHMVYKKPFQYWFFDDDFYHLWKNSHNSADITPNGSNSYYLKIKTVITF